MARVIMLVGALLGVRLVRGEGLARGPGADEAAVELQACLAQVAPWVLKHLGETAPLPAGDGAQDAAAWRLPATDVSLVSAEVLWWLSTTRAPLEVARRALESMLDRRSDLFGAASLVGNTLATIVRVWPAPVSELPLLALELPSTLPRNRERWRPGQPPLSPEAGGPRFDIFLRDDTLAPRNGESGNEAREAVARALLVPSLVQVAQLASLPEMQRSLRSAQEAVLASRDPREARDALAQVLAIQLVRQGQAVDAMNAFAKTLAPAQQGALTAILRDPRPKGARGGLVSLVNSAAAIAAPVVQSAPLSESAAPTRDLQRAALERHSAAVDWWTESKPDARGRVLRSLHQGPAAIAKAGFALPEALLPSAGRRYSTDRASPPNAVGQRKWGR